MKKTKWSPFDIIAATSSFEFKQKLEKKLCEKLMKKTEFTNAQYVEPTVDEINNMQFSIDQFSNYTEMLEDALLLCSIFSKRGYEHDNGRVHRSMARISILLAITAAEDYVNYILLTQFNYSKNKLSELDIVTKWEKLLPDLKTKYPDFFMIKKIRNKSVVHFKGHKNTTLQEILDLNYENGLKATDVVINMIKDYENNPKKCIRLIHSSYVLQTMNQILCEIFSSKF